MEERPYGKTGQKFPIFSFGAQRIVDGHGCSEEDAVKIVNYALDHGICYFDTAWVYSGGQSEERIGKVARMRRKEMWIATKALARNQSEARKQLEESLRRLQTDYVDEWRMHNVWSLDELDKITGPNGSLEAAVQARAQGLIAISASVGTVILKFRSKRSTGFRSTACFAPRRCWTILSLASLRSSYLWQNPKEWPSPA